MSGEGRYVLHTNAIVSLLGGNLKLNGVIRNAEWLGMSVISELEFMSYPQLDTEDALLFKAFTNMLEVVDLASSNVALMHSVVDIRKKHKVKLPDAIIVAVTMNFDAVLLTADKQLLSLFHEITKPLPG